MDPLTQGALGAALPLSCANRKQSMAAALLGFLAGMAADLDVLIQSDSDPLLFLEYHRQFTHSLIFIPLGGLLCALALQRLLADRWRLTFRQTLLFCTLGYATHALLDACTTYGTQLLWPFSARRFAWNTISIVDPLFTLPLLAGVIVSARRARPWVARAALAWALLYLSLGVWQRDRAEAVGWAIATDRGHQPLRLEAKPSFGNILLWKIVYETPERYHVDAVLTGLSDRIYPGASVPKLDRERDLPWLRNDSQQALDVERFRWFSNGYIAPDPDNPHRVIDIRYSLVPNEVAPLWSIELRPGAGSDEHAQYRTHRDVGGSPATRLWRMLLGRD